MKFVAPRSILSLALAAGVLGSTLVSTNSYACSSDPLLGSICVVAYMRGCPSGFLPADGRSLQIGQNTPLYSLIGITFGGDGQNTFNLPDLRGRVPVGVGTLTSTTSQVLLGQKRGQETIALVANNLPQHTHPATFTPTTGQVPLNIPAQATSGSITATASTDVVPGSTTAVDPAPSVPNYYLTGVTTSAAGPVTTTAPGSNKSTLIGTTVKVDASAYKAATAAQVVNVNAVTGGTVAVGANPTVNAPVATLPPQLGLYHCIATQGVYPMFD